MSKPDKPTNFFGCQETPLRFSDMKLTDLKTCKKCAVTLSTPVAGMCNLTDAPEGFIVNENIQSQLKYNGLSYTLTETRLLVPGAHQLPSDLGLPAIVAELHCYFQADSAANRSSTYCLVLPMAAGKGVGNTYFSLLGELTSTRPTLQTLFSATAPLLQYVGADIRGRSKKTPTPRGLCSPVASRINFLVSTAPAYILSTDLTRLMDRINTSKAYEGGPPIASIPADRIRAQSLITVVPSIKLLKVKGATQSAAQTTTAAMKCHRLDVGRDVKDGKVYVGGKKRPGDKTLQEELETASDPTKDLEGIEGGKPTVQPGDIENYLAIIFGVLLGIIFLGFISAFVLKNFNNYFPSLKNYFSKPEQTVLGQIKEGLERSR